MFQREGRDGFASASLAMGTFLVVVGALHHRILKAKFGPTGGEVELQAQARQVTARLAEAPEASLPEMLGPDEQDDATRWVLATRLFDQLLQEPDDALEGCALQLYLYDTHQDALLPVLMPGHAGPSPEFLPDQGATGRAWKTGEFVTAEGAAVWDETFDLSPDQQERYKNLAAVAAMPVTNATGQVIAVLSAATEDPQSRLLTDEGFEQFVFLAEAVARVLVDLLKWFVDGYDDGKSE